MSVKEDASMTIGKGVKEVFARFFEDPTRDKLREILQVNTGEEDYLDFKVIWPDNAKLAKHILAFANSGGGCLVVGVSQEKDGSLSAEGLSDGSFMDKAVLNQKTKKFLPDWLHFNIYDFHYVESEYASIRGKKFQVLLVEDDPQHIPFVAKTAGDKIRDGAIYIRSGTESIEANYEKVQQLINRRIETGYSTSKEMDLQEHLKQLKILYSNLAKNKNVPSSTEPLTGIEAKGEENYEEFISRMIVSKKKRIEEILDLEH